MECQKHLEKYKKKAMIATSDDLDESECESQSNEEKSLREVYAFMAYKSLKNSLVSESNSDEEESEDEEGIQDAFNKLYEENIDLGNTGKSLKKENKTLTQENRNLKEFENKLKEKTHDLEVNFLK